MKDQKTESTIVTEEIREKLYQWWKEHKTVNAVVKLSNLSHATVCKYKKLDSWEARKSKETSEALELYDHAKSLATTPLSEIREDTIRKLEIALNLRAKKIQEALANGEEGDGITNELQKMAAALEKSQVVEIKAQTGGLETKNINVNVQKIDYAKLAQLYVEAKREGIKFDDKGHLEKVMELAYEGKDKNGKSED